ncbi:MAG: hypothetical protein ABGX83_05370 [Nitrospira sp.]
MKNNRDKRLAKEIWPEAYWIHGSGRFACLAHCRVLTIELYTTREGAEKAKGHIDKFACGGRCSRTHEIVELEGEVLR